MSTTADPIHNFTEEKPASESAATTDRVSAKAHETVDRVAASAASAEEKLRAQAAEASARVHDAREQVAQKSRESAEQLQSYARENPLKTAGIAFAAGFVISALMRRPRFRAPDRPLLWSRSASAPAGAGQKTLQPSRKKNLT